jgi:UDP-N-acetylglucosamine acyltransferase
MTTSIHPSALVDPGARLGVDVKVGPGAIIDADVEIGSGCIIGPHAVLHSFTILGPDCRIHAGAVIGDTPQDMAFKKVKSHVRLGARVVVREGVTIHRGTKEDTVTTTGDDCYFMVNSHLAHNCTLGNRVILANGVLLGGYVEIGDGAFVSGNAVIHQFCRVGRLAMVGGLSGISKDVPPFCMTRSGSINRVVGLNVVGLRRTGFNAGQRAAVRSCFDLLYRSDINVTQAVEQLAARPDDPVAAEFVAFIRGAKRGICRYSRHGAGEEE